MPIKLTTEEVIKRAQEKHGQKYEGSAKKRDIICSDHGNFLQDPKGHLKKRVYRCASGFKPYSFDSERSWEYLWHQWLYMCMYMVVVRSHGLHLDLSDMVIG